ncbi:MAG: FeoB-associated Cys-rich membrane protein [Clostridiales bacterium]|nr:FeoB-associated Cys-rich membrane protein [Clostridiales bacterium]
MLSFLAANAGTALVGLLLLCAVALIVRKIAKDKKKGGCGCGCPGCGTEDNCRK